MERFRQSWLDSPSTGAGGGFNSFSSGGGEGSRGDGGDGRGSGGSGSGGNGNRSGSTQRFTGERRPPALGLETPTGGNRAARGLASFSPAASAPLRTPDARGDPDSQGAPTTTPLQQEGFSLFGGRMYSTPVSGTRRPPSEPPTLVARALTQMDGGRDGGGGDGGGGVDSNSGGSGGLSRFKTLAQQTQERKDREKREEQDWRRRSGASNPARGALTPSELSPPTMGSPPPIFTPHNGSGGSAGGPFGRTSSTNVSPTMSSSAEPLGAAAMPVAASARKRPRAPSPAAIFAASPPPSLSAMSGTTQPSPIPGAAAVAAADVSRDLRRDPREVPAVRQARTWGSTDGTGAGRPPQQKSPRPNVRRAAGAAEAAGGAGAAGKRLSTPSSRSPRPRTKSPSQSPRARAASSQQYSSQPPPLPRRYTLEDFAGADEVCFNPGEVCLLGLVLRVLGKAWSSRDEPFFLR